MGRRELVIYECDGYHPEGACESGEPIAWVGVRDGGPDNEPNVLGLIYMTPLETE